MTLIVCGPETKSGQITENLSGHIRADDNAHIEIGAGCRSTSLSITASGCSRVVIGNHVNLGALRIYARDSIITIGDRSSFNHNVRLLAHEPSKITIGSHCLFGHDVDVTSSDMHSLVDTTTGRRINPAAPIVIGDRVWIGMRTTILKGARIDSGSAIACSSVVARTHIPENCVAGGVPARVLRKNVTWDFNLLSL